MTAKSGAGSRNKGSRGERQVIALLQPVVNTVYGLAGFTAPELQRNLLQAIKGGSDVHGLEWLAMEVKFCETLQLSAWWKQATEQAQAGQCPVLIYRAARTQWRVRMYGYLYGQRHAIPVDIQLLDFLAWFEQHLTERVAEMARQRRS